MRFDPGNCFVPAPINLDMHGDEEIFAIINKSIKIPGTDYDPPTILKWFTDQMKTTDTIAGSNRHLILRIDFTGSPAKRAAQLEKFCHEFIRLYTAWTEKLTVQEKMQYGKVFLLISDASTGGLELNGLGVNHSGAGPHYNFIPFQKISKIKLNHIKYWLTKFSEINRSELVQKLTDEDVLIRWVADTEYEHDTFIERFCTYCGFTREEVDTLNAQLYDYNKTFLI
ncbi:MAG: hypothetical protein EOO94_05035 [Pedobacter sp.]|nr:MAG: hypothetical protein EOO94_05035 [Pedobacter sp.]